MTVLIKCDEAGPLMGYHPEVRQFHKHIELYVEIDVAATVHNKNGDKFMWNRNNDDGNDIRIYTQ